MISSLFGVCALTLACGLSTLSLNHDINKSISVENSYDIANATYWRDSTSEFENTGVHFYAGKFGSTPNDSTIHHYTWSEYNNNVWGGELSSIEIAGSPYAFAYTGYYADFLDTYDYVCIMIHWESHVVGSSYYDHSFAFTFIVNSTYAKSLSNAGCVLGVDLAFSDFSISEDSTLVNIFTKTDNYVYTASPYYSGVSKRSNEYEVGYISDLPLNIEQSYGCYNPEYTYFSDEEGDYVERTRLALTSSFVDVGASSLLDTGDSTYMYNYQFSYVNFRGDSNTGFYDIAENVEMRFVSLPLDNSNNIYYQDGYADGYSAGYNTGIINSDGYNEGFEAGYRAGQGVGTTWFGLFGAIADTPVIMLRGLFDFDLFGMNILTVALSLITAICVFWLIKKVI